MRFYAVCQFYEPFIMGGDVWQFRKYYVDGTAVQLANDISGFVFVDHTVGEYHVHEVLTGIRLSSHMSESRAIAIANENIEMTSDLADQIRKFGDGSRYIEVPMAEALKRIKAGTRK